MKPETAAELGRGQVRELSDAVDGSRVKPLVSLGAAEIGLENRKSVGVLRLIGIALPEAAEETGEVGVGVEDEIIGGARNNLLDQGVLGDEIGSGGDGEEGEEEEREAT